MDPLVSERLHLEWRPDGAVAERDEAEQVIVLQGRSGFFLDVRWGKGATPRLTRCTAGWKTIEAARPGEGAASKSCFKGGGRVVTPSYGSDWPSLLAEGRARFTPIFDSDRPDANGPSPDAEDVDGPDEGSFTTLPNGDVLEHGEMRRPETRIKTPYEELWRRLPLTADGGQPLILLLESVGDDGEKAFLGRVGEHQVGTFRALTMASRARSWSEDSRATGGRLSLTSRVALQPCRASRPCPRGRATSDRFSSMAEAGE